MTIELIVSCLIVYFFILVFYVLFTYGENGTFYFNPIENYNNWKGLNLLGVTTFTLLINILFAPLAASYWIIKFFIFIFTFGRR